MIKFICIIIIFNTLACATVKNTEARMQARVGTSIDNVINQYGPPTSSFKRPDGNMMYSWESGGTTTGRVLNGFGGPQVQYTSKWCKVSYTVDGSGIITNWNLAGNNCASR